MPTATVTSKGQVTLPKKVREALRIKPGDQVDFVLESEGAVRVRAARNDVRDLKGILHRPGRKPVSLEAMDEAIERRGQPK
ncbi:MAG TPA: AbrB/MazE/SpoVT family DNA-binding domain-containing protein [Vicinamibacteria bacterium]|nr:AbrB/MazE/SpoVT family DNA-binding domain-containing protein [Vicinamibacteria bacterium]